VTSLDQKAMTCRLQEVCSQAAHALAAPMAQSTALMAPTALGLFGSSSHEPFHADGGQRSMAVTERSGKTPPQLAMVRQDSRTGRYTGRSTVLRLLYQEASKEGERPRPGRGHGCASLVLLDHPIVAETVFVASGAVLIGRVTVSAGASIWYGAVLRADQDSIFVGERSHVQDGCVLEADPGVPLSLGSDVTLGHNATLHGCIVEDQVLIGMGAIVLNGAHVGRHDHRGRRPPHRRAAGPGGSAGGRGARQGAA